MNNLPEEVEIVDSFVTLQGEGPFAGTKAFFIRTAGCNIQCPLCDTQYTKGRHKKTVDQIIDDIPQDVRLVVITGGEPLRQNLSLLIECILSSSRSHVKYVQIETNGTLCPEWFMKQVPYFGGELVTVISPKGQIHPDWSRVPQSNIHWKYVVHCRSDIDKNGLPVHTLGRSAKLSPPISMDNAVDEGRVFIQPADEHDESLNVANRNRAVKLCMLHGFRLCLQIQKIIALS